MVHLETETLPAYFLKVRHFETNDPLPRYRGELFTTTTGDFVRKHGRVIRDVGLGQSARQDVSPKTPLTYQRALKVQPENEGVPLIGRVETDPQVYPYRLRLKAEVAPPGGEVTR